MRGGARLDGHARWPVATDRAQPPRPALADGVTDELPQWRLRLCTTRAGLRRTLGLAPSLQGTTDGQRRLGCRPPAHRITS